MLSILFRFLWSVTIGLVFFAIGLVLFLLFDILHPSSDRGYRILNYMYKIGSLGSFKGLSIGITMERDDYDVTVEKKRY